MRELTLTMPAGAFALPLIAVIFNLAFVRFGKFFFFLESHEAQ